MNDELLKALQLIKEECEKYADKCCNGCPMLSANEDCGVMEDKPNEWALKKGRFIFK